MSSHSWLRTDMSANRWQQTYFKNFVDISGDLYIRKGGISAGDNADKFTVDASGDISANSVNIAGNLSVVSGVQIQDGGSAIYVKSNNKNRLVLGDKVLNGANNNTIVVHNNKVGIGGVWTPSHTLDVSGDIDISGGILTGDNGEYFPIRHTDFTSYNQGQLLFRRSGHVYLGGGQLRFCIGDPTDNTMVKMMIAGSGNIGIGTGTNAPGAKLDVDGDIHATSLDINSSAFTVSSSGVVNAVSLSATSLSATSLSATSLSATSLSGTLNTAAQPNITSVGELNGLDVSGPVHLYSGDESEGGEITLAYPDITSSSGTQKKWHIDVAYNNDLRIFSKEGSDAATNAMNISTNGNVGIGTTNPAYKLDVNGLIRARGNGSAGVRLGSYSSGLAFVYGEDGTSAAQFAIGHGANEVMRLKDRNVGIGTTDPKTKLEIPVTGPYDGLSLSYSSVKLVLGNTVDGAHNSGSIQVFSNVSGATPTSSSSTYKLSLQPLGGNVGIGTDNPGHKLDVNGNVQIDGNLYLKGTWIQSTNVNNGDIKLQPRTANDNVIVNQGNVGIGTNNPQYTLDVSGDIDISGGMLVGKSDAAYFKIQHKDYTPSGTIPEQIRLRKDGDVYITSTSNSGKGIRFYNGSSEVVRITGGNVGIGTTSPAQKLEVDGIIQSKSWGFINKNDYGWNYFRGYGNQTVWHSDYASRFTNGISPTSLSMIIAANGRIGMGTDNPGSKLMIVGDSLDSTSTDPSTSGYAQLEIQSESNYNSDLGKTTLQIGADHRNNTGFIQTINDWKYVPNLILNPRGGRVGMGTDNPSKTLDVSGDIQFSGYLYKNGALFNPGSQWTTTGSNIYYNTGNVGIGTTSPASGYKLDVNGVIGANTFTGNSTGTTLFTSSSGHAVLRSNGGNAYIDATGANNIVFRTTNASTNRMYIANDGDVGIGTTSPQAKLHIQGTYGTQPQLILVGGTNQNATIRTYSGHSASSPGTNIYQEIDFAHYAAIGNENNNQINFKVSNGVNAPVTRMIINGHGRVGIGTTSPDYDLHIISNNSDTLSSVSHYYLTFSGTNGGSGSATVNTSVYADDSYVTNGYFFAYSDRRIKTNITDIDDDIALQQLRLIQPKTYEYIDKIHRTNQTVFGFIAQEVGEVMTNAVSTVKGIIPNIFESANVSQSDNHDYNIVTLTDFDTADLDVSSNVIQVIGSNNAKHTVTISEVIDNKTIRVDTDLSEWMGAVDASGNVTRNEVQTYNQVILDASNNVVLENYDITLIASIDASDNVVGKMADLTGDNTIDSSGNYVDASGNTIAAINADGHYIDASGNYFDADGNFKDASGSLIGTYKASWKNVIINGTGIFVYGQKIDDLCTLNKDAIFTVATAALQEVDRQLQAEKAKVAALESQMADLLARVTALESA